MNITASAVFVKDGKVLFEKRRDDEDNYAGLWAIPGGHQEQGEAIEETLVREMQEELGVKVTKFKFLGIFKDIDPTSKMSYEHHAFLCIEWEGEIKDTTEEEKVEWFSEGNFPEPRLSLEDEIYAAAKKFL